MASLCQGRTAAAQCGLFTYKSVPVIFEPPCNWFLPPGRQCSHFLNTINKFAETLTNYNYIHERNCGRNELKECLLLFSSEIFLNIWYFKNCKDYFISMYYLITWGMPWRSWLMHCATSWKVAGSIPESVIWIFHSFLPRYGPGVDSASNRNEYQEHSLGVNVAGA